MTSVSTRADVTIQTLHTTPMPYDPNLILENSASRARLRALFARLTDAQYDIPLDSDWTVGTALAHVAVFDSRALEIIDLWSKNGVAPSPSDVDVLNAALLPFLRALPPAAISKLVIDLAEKLDAKLAALPDSVLDQFDTVAQHPFSLSRANHRNEHIDQIQRVLKAS
jgi:hypothetical protein